MYLYIQKGVFLSSKWAFPQVLKVYARMLSTMYCLCLLDQMGYQIEKTVTSLAGMKSHCAGQGGVCVCVWGGGAQ